MAQKMGTGPIIHFCQQGKDSDRRTRVGGGWILVEDSGYKRRMDDRPQRGLGVGEVDPLGHILC